MIAPPIQASVELYTLTIPAHPLHTDPGARCMCKPSQSKVIHAKPFSNRRSCRSCLLVRASGVRPSTAVMVPAASAGSTSATALGLLPATAAMAAAMLLPLRSVLGTSSSSVTPAPATVDASIVRSFRWNILRLGSTAITAACLPCATLLLRWQQLTVPTSLLASAHHLAPGSAPTLAGVSSGGAGAWAAAALASTAATRGAAAGLAGVARIGYRTSPLLLLLRFPPTATALRRLLLRLLRCFCWWCLRRDGTAVLKQRSRFRIGSGRATVDAARAAFGAAGRTRVQGAGTTKRPHRQAGRQEACRAGHHARHHTRHHARHHRSAHGHSHGLHAHLHAKLHAHAQEVLRLRLLRLRRRAFPRTLR